MNQERLRKRESYPKRSCVDLKRGVMGRAPWLRITQCPYLDNRNNNLTPIMSHVHALNAAGTQLCAVDGPYEPFFSVDVSAMPVKDGKLSLVCASYQYKCLQVMDRCTKADVAKGTFKYVYNVYEEEECQSLKKRPEYKDVKCCKSTCYNPCNLPDPKKDPGVGWGFFPDTLTPCK
jgi:hypothetical protein